jgi:hypothetical protein
MVSCHTFSGVSTTMFKAVVWQDVDWIRLAQDTDEWRAIVSTVMKFRVP